MTSREMPMFLQKKPRVYTRGSGLLRSGFLLIEGMIASVILAVSAIAIASLLLTANQQAMVMRENATAAALAEQMLEEIASKPLGTYPWTAPPASRSSFVTAEDYNGYSDTTSSMTGLAAGAVTPGDGQPYSRSVTVVAQTGPTGSSAPMGDFALVTVTITTPTQQKVTFSRLIAKTDWAT